MSSSEESLLKRLDALFSKNPNAVGPIEQLGYIGEGTIQTAKNVGRAGIASVLDIPAILPALAGFAAAPFSDSDRGVIEQLANPAPDAADKSAFSSEFLLGLANAIGKKSDEVTGKLTADPTFDRTNLPGTDQTLGVMTSAAFGGPLPLARLLQNAPTAAKVAGQVVEVLTPYTAPLNAKNIALNAIVQGVVDQGARAALDAPTLVEREGWLPPTPEQLPSQQILGDPPSLPPMPVGSGPIKFEIDGETIEIPEEVIKVALDGWEESEYDQQKLGERWGVGEYAAAGSVASILVYLFLRGRFLMNNMARGEGSVSIGGNPKSSLESQTTLGEKAKTYAIDSEGILGSQLERAVRDISGSPDIAKASRVSFEAENVTRTRYGGAESVLSALRTGKIAEFPDIEMPSLVEWQERFGVLDAGRKQTLNEGLFAADELDNRALGQTVNANDPYTDTRLTAQVSAMRNDPILLRMEGDYRRMTDAMLTVAERHGLVSKQQVADLRAQRGNYMPRKANPLAGLTQFQGFVERLKNTANIILGDPKFENQFFDDANAFLQRSLKGEGTLKDVVQPAEALEQYMTSLMLAGNKNKMQLSFIDTMLASPQFSKSIRKVDPHNVKDKSGSPNVVGVKRNGVNEFYEFADNTVATSLKYQPFAIPGRVWLNLPRRIFQAGATGAFQPFFAFKSAVWDPAFGATVKNRERAFGIIDQAMRDVGFTKGIQGDPTAIIGTIYGVGRDGAAQMADAMSLAIMRDLEDPTSFFSLRSLASPMRGMNKAIQGLGGETLLRNIADSMRDSYLKSTRAMLQQYGGYNTGFMADPALVYSSLIGKATPAFNARDIPIVSPVLRFYRGTLEALHNSSRLAFFAQNYKAGMSDGEIRKLIKETRDLTGDFTRSGDGRGYRIAASAIPYANVTMQATRQLANAARRDPSGFVQGVMMSTVVPTLGAMSLLSMSSQEIQDWWWSLPAWQRASNIPIVLSDTPDDVELIPVAPELVAFKEMVLAGAAGLGIHFGRSDQKLAPQFHDFRQAISQVAGFAAPPLANVLANATGNTIDMGGPIAGESAFRPIAELRTQSGSVISPELPNNVLQMVSSIGATAANMFINLYSTVQQAREMNVDPVHELGKAISWEARRRMPLGRTMWGGRIQYGGPPISVEMHNKIDLVQDITDQINKQNSNAELGLEDLTDPYIRVPPTIDRNTDAYAQLLAVQQFYEANPLIKELQSARTRLLKEKEALTLNRIPQSHDVKQEKINALQIELNNTDAILAQLIASYEEAEGVKLEDLAKMMRQAR